MKIFLDCLPCLLRQALEAAKMATKDEKIHEKVMQDTISILNNFEKYPNSPMLAKKVHDSVKKYTGLNDPYKKIKEKDIKTAKKLYPQLVDFFNKNDKSLKSALKISSTGNIIDSAIYFNIDIENGLNDQLQKDFSIFDIDIFNEKLKNAKTLLIIGDNSGETVFDKILTQKLKDLKIYYAVRNEPIINDATIYEAEISGLNEYATVISSGSSCPGTVLEDCNKEFLDIYNNADIIISKGQGNFESLSNAKRDIFFLLKAKCQMVADELNTTLNSFVFKYKS